MSTILPRPDVVVTPATDDNGFITDVVISRDGKAKSYRGTGTANDIATTDVIKKILNDPHTAEWLP